MTWGWIVIGALTAIIATALIGTWIYKQVLHRWITWRSLPRETPYERRRRRCRIEILEAEDFLESQYRYFALRPARRSRLPHGRPASAGTAGAGVVDAGVHGTTTGIATVGAPGTTAACESEGPFAVDAG